MFRIALAGSVVLGLTLTWMNRELRSSVAPQGIHSLEFARSADRAGGILDVWSRHPGPGPAPAVDPLHPLSQVVSQGERVPEDTAFYALLLSFPFLLLYTLALSLAALWIGGGRGIAFAWLALLAGLLDALRTTLLLRMLGEGPREPLPGLTFACASVRLIVVIAALEFIAFAAWRRGARFGATAAQLAALFFLIPALLA